MKASIHVPQAGGVKTNRNTSLLDQYISKAKKSDSSNKTKSHRELKLLGEGKDLELDEEKLKKEIQREKERMTDLKGKRRADTEVTEESLEAYRLTKSLREDPMAKYLSK